MFKLPNGNKIDVELVEMAMEGSSDENSLYLNLQTGEVTFYSPFTHTSDEIKEIVEEIEFNSGDYVPIEKIPSRQVYRWMSDFVTDIVAPQNAQAAETLSFALEGPKPFRRFKDALSIVGDEWKQAWYRQKDEYFHKAMTEWFESLPVKITEE